MAKILIIVGSKSDLVNVEKHIDILKDLGIEYSIEVASAHRDPQKVTDLSKNAKTNNIEVIIAGAGLAAALPGVIAAHTNIPVIGVPISSGPLNGFDALLSIAQMPPGVPVGTMGINNFKNAYMYAASILSIKYEDISKKLNGITNK